jgi:hypothetical protein
MAEQSAHDKAIESGILSWADSVYDEAERELSESREMRLTGRLIEYISGRQWSDKSRFGRSKPTINRLWRQFIEQTSLLTDIEPDFQVKFPAASEDLLNEDIGMWARQTDFEMELTQSVMWALLHTGYAKIQWNPNLNGGLGDVEFLPLGPLEVMTIGAGRKLEDEECVIGRWPVTVESLVRTYGETARDVMPDLETSNNGGNLMRPQKMSQATWVRLPPSLKRMLGQRSPNAPRSRYPRAMLKQFWFQDSSINDTNTTQLIGRPNTNWCYYAEPGMPLYPRGRVIVVAGGKVLQDQPNPYWHGRFPFAKLRLIRVPWNTNGLSPLEPGAMMQDIINRINGGILDMIRASIEPKLIGPKAAFAQSVWDSMDPGAPGAKVAYNNNSPGKPEYVRPPELPAYVLTQKQDIEREQDASSGASAINQSLQKKQVPGGDSLEMIMSSRSLPIRFMGRGLQSRKCSLKTPPTASSSSGKPACSTATSSLTTADSSATACSQRCSSSASCSRCARGACSASKRAMRSRWLSFCAAWETFPARRCSSAWG